MRLTHVKSLVPGHAASQGGAGIQTQPCPALKRVSSKHLLAQEKLAQAGPCPCSHTVRLSASPGPEAPSLWPGLCRILGSCLYPFHPQNVCRLQRSQHVPSSS